MRGRVGRGLGFLGLEPGGGFGDALGEGGAGWAEEGVGFFHRDEVVGDHAAVAGGGDVEGFSGEGGDEVSGEAGGAEDGAGDFAGGFAVEGAAEGVGPMVNVAGRVADIEGLAVDFFGGLVESEGGDLVGDIADISVAADDGFSAGVDIEALGGDAPEFLGVARVPGAPDVGGADDDPFAGEVGAAGFLLGDDFALAVDGGGEVVFVVGGEASGAADELGRADEGASDGGGGLNGGEEVAGALGVGAEAGFSGRFFVHLGAGGEVEDDVGGEGLECGGEGGGVEDVGGLPVGLMGGLVGRVDRKVENFVAAGEEAVDDMGADEAGAAGDEDFHG
jgi:hypothetical protein